MPIELIDKIAPKNDGFTGMVDADQVLGGGGSGTLPNAVVAVANVTQHEASLSIAGSQLTGTVSTARLEAKMKTYSKVFYLEDPVADNIYPLAWLHGADAISLGRFGGTVDTGTAVLQLVDRPITAAFSGGTNRLSGNLTVDTAYTDGDDSTTSFSGGAGLSDTSLWVKVVSVTGSPTKLLVFLEASVDD